LIRPQRSTERPTPVRLVLLAIGLLAGAALFILAFIGLHALGLPTLLAYILPGLGWLAWLTWIYKWATGIFLPARTLASYRIRLPSRRTRINNE
jgi:hypothetical protein